MGELFNFITKIERQNHLPPHSQCSRGTSFVLPDAERPSYLIMFIQLSAPPGIFYLISYSSVQFSHSVVSDSLRSHELQHSRPPCPSPTPGVHPNPCPLSRWCHPTTSSSVVPFSSCPHLSQHQGLFKWVSSLHQVAKVLEFQLQYQSFQWIFRIDFF